MFRFVFHGVISNGGCCVKSRQKTCPCAWTHSKELRESVCEMCLEQCIIIRKVTLKNCYTLGDCHTTRLEYETRKVCYGNLPWPRAHDTSIHEGFPHLPPFPCTHTPYVCSARRRRLSRVCSLGAICFAPQHSSFVFAI